MAYKSNNVQVSAMQVCLLIAERSHYCLTCMPHLRAINIQNALNMMITKTITRVLTVAMLMGTSIGATAQTVVGWTDGNHSRTSGFRAGDSTTQGVAIRLPQSKAQLLKGHTIAAVNAAFCSSRMRDFTLFITDDLAGEPLYSQSLDGSSTSWTEYALDTPYEITGDEIYIGFTGTISTIYLPLSFDGSSGYAETSYVYNNGTWEDYYEEGYGSANIQLILSDTCSFTDASLRIGSIDGYYRLGESYDIACGQLFNFGSNTITSIDITYAFSDGDVQVQTIDTLSIESNSLADIVLPSVSFASSGIYDATISVSAVNGNEYDDDATDNSGDVQISIYPSDTARNYLVENFTGQACTNCPSGHKLLESAVGDRDDVVIVAHHSGYGNDAFTMAEDMSLLFFNDASGGTFAPGFMTNRYRIDSQSSSYSCPAFSIGDEADITDRLDLLSEMQPYVTVVLSKSFDEETRLLSGTVDVHAYAQLPNDTAYINLYIVQDSIEAYQKSGGDNYMHRHVFRGTIDTDAFGVPFRIAAGDTYTHSFSYTVPESITSSYLSSTSETFDVVLDHMSLVAFVSNYNADDPNDCIVYNADSAPFLDENSTTGITNVEGKPSSLNIYSDGGQLFVNSQCSSVKVYDISGKMVGAIDGGSGSLSLNNGVYIVRAQTADGTVARKIVVSGK